MKEPFGKYDTAFTVLLCLTAVLFSVHSVYLGDAASNNLAYAMSLYERGEPLFYRRGPLYYGMAALSFKLFGPSIEHAVWVTRLFVPVNLALVYLIARSMFSPRAGFIAALLVFFSHAVNLEAAKLELDNVMPAFMLLSVWLFWAGTKRRSPALSAAAGAALGLGWLVKEASMLFLPVFFVPLLLANWRDRGQWARSGLAIAAFALTLSPWIAYILAHGGGPADVFGAASPRSTVTHLKLPVSFSSYVLQHFVFNGPSNLVNYLRNFFIPNFPLWLPMLLALAYAAWRAFRARSLELALLVSGVVLFSPIAVYQGGIGERLGQCYVLFLLLYILLAFSVDRLFGALPSKLPAFSGKRLKSLMAATLATFILLELFNPFGEFARSTFFAWTLSESRLSVMNAALRSVPEGWFTRMADAASISGERRAKLEELLRQSRKQGFQVGERFDEGVEQAAQWLVGEAPSGSTIYAASALIQSLPFYTRFHHRFESFEGAGRVQYRPYDQGSIDLEPLKPLKLLGLVSYHGFQNEDIPRYRSVFLYFEGPFLGHLNEKSASYLVLHKSDSHLKRYSDFFIEYFSRSKNLTVAFDNYRTRIYKVTGSFSPIAGDFFYSNSEFGSDMAWLKDSFPDSHERMVKELSLFLSEDRRPLLSGAAPLSVQTTSYVQ